MSDDIRQIAESLDRNTLFGIMEVVILSYDLMVLSVGVKHKSDVCCGNIVAERLNGFGSVNNERYPWAGSLSGTWFELRKVDTLPILGSFDLCDFAFENDDYKLFWRSEKIKTDHYAMFLKPEVQLNDFETSIKSLQDLSPDKMLVFLPRIDGNTGNDICGVLTCQQFIDLVNQGKVYSNLCYVIKD